MPTCVVVGNPKPQSRTLAAATLLMEQLTGRPPDSTIDVITLGAGLLGWGDPGVAAAVATVKQADVLVVASPTYKATYTGLLKLLLDQFGAGSLDGALAYPLMLGAGMQHALAPELLLKPVLVEIGGFCPVQGLFLLDTDTALTGAEQWLRTARRYLPQQYTAEAGSEPPAPVTDEAG
jgi:FMN reductase